MSALAFSVFGSPAPQGSKRHVGRGVLIESSKGVKPWRAAVAAAAKALRASLANEWRPADGPVRVSLVFSLRRPKKPRWRSPAVAPDLDKLARSTLDALTGVLIHDDARVIGFDRLEKVYVGSDDPEALAEPGCSIVVREG